MLRAPRPSTPNSPLDIAERTELGFMRSWAANSSIVSQSCVLSESLMPEYQAAIATLSQFDKTILPR